MDPKDQQDPEVTLVRQVSPAKPDPPDPLANPDPVVSQALLDSEVNLV